MANTLFPNAIINDLQEFYMIAGRNETLVFNVYDSGSAAVNLAGTSIIWLLAPYGSTDSVLTKTCIKSGSPINRFSVILTNADTDELSGKYVHQYTITNSGSYVRPSQGIIFILPALTV